MYEKFVLLLDFAFFFHFMTPAYSKVRNGPILALPPQRFINTPWLWKASSASDTVKYDITIENSKENFSEVSEKTHFNMLTALWKHALFLQLFISQSLTKMTSAS